MSMGEPNDSFEFSPGRTHKPLETSIAGSSSKEESFAPLAWLG
jgi:hypothetical protein